MIYLIILIIELDFSFFLCYYAYVTVIRGWEVLKGGYFLPAI